MRVCPDCGREHKSFWCPPPEHPTAAKQREQMHKAVARDAKMRDEDLAQSRREAEQRDARRNQSITRGEILDALDGARECNLSMDAYTLLDALRRAFE